MNEARIRRALLVAFSGLLTAGAAAPARAQAWLPPKGEGWFSLGYGNTFSKGHYLGVVDPDGTNQEDVGHTRVNSVGLAAGYGITDRLALAFGIPFIAGKYMGDRPHRLNGVIQTGDDGSYHGTFQDYRINLAYRLVNGSVAMSPFFTAVIPSHSYAILAHAAPGRGLHEYLLGFSAGSRLDGILPGSYAQVTYAYAFVERVEAVDVNLDRSYFDAQVGYFLTPSLALRFLDTTLTADWSSAILHPRICRPRSFPTTTRSARVLQSRWAEVSPMLSPGPRRSPRRTPGTSTAG